MVVADVTNYEKVDRLSTIVGDNLLEEEKVEGRAACHMTRTKLWCLVSVNLQNLL